MTSLPTSSRSPNLRSPNVRRFPQLRPDNINFVPGSGNVAALGLAMLGLVCIAVVGGAGATDLVFARHALAVYHIGSLAAMTMCLGATFFVMLFYLTNAGWAGTVRRQFENVMSFLPIAFLFAAATPVLDYFVGGGKLFTWMSHINYGDHLLQKKFFYFFGTAYDAKVHLSGPTGTDVFPVLYFARIVLYGVLWTFITRRLLKLSLLQDETADPQLTVKARFMCAWGILVMALTTAFVGFDLLMSLDYRFFSTMWGVYIFAGSAFSSVALMALILSRIRAKGKLEGAVTTEHFHDIGKLLFSFTVFWAYIGFSQYFLIWYSNIPEETAFYVWREQGNWLYVGQFLIFGHFVAPFLILLFRKVKQSPSLLSIIALWAIFIHIVDLFWIIRPMAYVGEAANQDPGIAAGYVDVAGMLGPVLLLGAYLIYRIGKTKLIAVNDPFMHEALAHKNHV